MNASTAKRSLIMLLAASGVLSVASGATRAEFTLVEDFDELVPGSINGQNGWVAASASSQVIADPADPDNQVLEVTADSTTAYAVLLIPDGTVRTLFFRFRFAQQLNYSFGMSDTAAPAQFHDFESEIGLRNAINELRIRDGIYYDVLGTLVPGTWYSVWMLINNTDNTTQVYLHTRPGDRATSADLQDAAGQTVFEFRNGTAGNLLTYFIKTGGGNSDNSGPLYIDDIYVENTEAPNFCNPTAIPADLTCDGFVDAADLALLLGSWGPCAVCEDCPVDLNDDCQVNIADLSLLLGSWGARG